MQITFSLSRDIIGDATEALLLGDFNNWDPKEGIGLTIQEDGSLAAIVSLEPGKTYQYRYFLNDGRWVNDSNADQYAHNPSFQVDNCVITVPAKKLGSKKKAEATDAPKKEKTAKKQKAEKVSADSPIALIETKPDDLTKIEGIGKKIAALLADAGITDFRALSKSPAKKLKSVLDSAGSKFKMHDPASWPKQAKLAAAGKWDALKALQAELKGGK